MFAHPIQYLVKKKGAVLREQVLLASDEVCILDGGTTVLCDRSETLVDRVRVHVYEPQEGWVTAKCLDGGEPQRLTSTPGQGRTAAHYADLEKQVAARDEVEARDDVERRPSETWWLLSDGWAVVRDTPSLRGKTLGFVERGAAVLGDFTDERPDGTKWLQCSCTRFLFFFF